MGIALSKDFGIAVLRAMGIDTKRVRGFTLNVQVNKAVTITIERMVELPEDATGIDEVFRSVRLGRKILSETFELDAANED